MKYSSRFFLYAPLAVFLGIAAGASYIWWQQAGALSARLDALNGHEAMPGVTLRFASKSVSGFPFNLDVVFQDFRVEVATGHGPATWRAQNAALHALTYGREQAILEAAGQQVLGWHDSAGKPHALPFAVGEMHASAIAGERGLSRFDLDVIGLESPALNAGRLQLHARVAPDGRTVEIAAAGDVIHLSPRLASLFGDDVTLLRVNASAAPSRAFDGLRAGRTDWVHALETWRKANGTLALSDVEITWSRIGVHGKGALSLDEQHAVLGMIDFKVAGIQTLLDAAQRRHVQGEPLRGIAPALLLRAAQAGANEAGLVGAVVAFHSGIVSVGDVQATDEEPLY